MPCVPVQVEKDRNQIAHPTTSPSTSATCAKAAGSRPAGNSASASFSGIASTSCRARSYSASSRTSRGMTGTSAATAGRTRVDADGIRGTLRTATTVGPMTTTRRIETWLTDMDGVLVHEDDPIPGASEFIEELKASG